MPRAGSGIFGLRKHAGGGSTNTHATGGIDALTPGDIGAGSAPTLKITSASATNVTLATAYTEVASSELDAGFSAFMLLHVFADIGSGGVTDTARATIRFHFSDGSTKDGVESGDAGLNDLIAHYDNAANTGTADQWATAETPVNLLTVLGTSQNNKKLNKVSLRAKRTSVDNNAVFDWNLKVGGMQA